MPFKKLIMGLVSFVIVGAIVVGVVKHSDNQKSVSVDKKNVVITVSAAASLKDSLTELQKVYEKKHSNVKIRFNFGASGALQKQIEMGAPVDLFFSAGKDKFNLLVNEGIISKKEAVDLVGNELVLITSKDPESTVSKFKDLKKKNVSKISIGTPESVPAGQYAKESFEKMNMWSSINYKIVYAKDVRQVLTYVETGNADAGVVYKTDAMTSNKIKMIETADEKTHQPIIYPVGIIKNSKYHNETKKFYQFLQSEISLETFEKFGFSTL